MWPLNGDAPYIFGENVTGIDNIGLFENDRGEIIGTHTGQIYKLFKSGSTSISSLYDFASHKPELDNNYPNPFSSVTTIGYQLHKPCKVTLKIYNSLGQEVSTLVDQFQEAGSYNIQWDAKSNASGLYFYHLKQNIPIISNLRK